MRNALSVACQLALGLGGSLVTSGAALAQTPASNLAIPAAARSPRPEKSASSWRVSEALIAGAEFDDNLFLVAPNKKDNIAAPSADDRTSGRYANMESAYDILTSFSAAVAVKGPGLKGRSLELSPEVDYDRYTQNTERSNVRLGLSLKQELWADSRLRLQGQFMPSFFAKNYLADAADLDANGSISDNERQYASGEYREATMGGDYRIPLAKSTKKHPFGVALQLDGGYYQRTFDDPFPGRDLNGPNAGAELLVDLGRRVTANLSYAFAPLGATTTQEVVLLDEAGFGQDFNNNGSTTDQDVRVVTGVDRSRRERGVGASLQFSLSKSADLGLGFEHRWREFTSTEPLDVSNNGRLDARNQWSTDLRVRLMKDLRLRLGGAYTAQTTNRSGDPSSTGEVDDYTRYQGSLGLSYEL